MAVGDYDLSDRRAEAGPAVTCAASESESVFLFPSFVDTKPGGLNLGPYAISSVYDRNADTVLGDTGVSSDSNPPSNSALLPISSHCYNCGSPLHSYRACPEPHNRELIALSRQLFQFYSSVSPRSERFYIAHGWQAKRLCWVDSFSPGRIRGCLLRDALGIRVVKKDPTSSEPGVDADDDSEPDNHTTDQDVDYPWLASMARWGYPPGWVGMHDPRDRMRHRIQYGDDIEDESLLSLTNGDTIPFMIYLEDGICEQIDVSSSSHFSILEPRKAVSSRVSSFTVPLNASVGTSRWAQYPRTQFSSALLPVYNGNLLPSLDSYSCAPFAPPPPSTTPPPLPSPPSDDQPMSVPFIPSLHLPPCFPQNLTSKTTAWALVPDVLQVDESEEVDMVISDSDDDL